MKRHSLLLMTFFYLLSPIVGATLKDARHRSPGENTQEVAGSIGTDQDTSANEGVRSQRNKVNEYIYYTVVALLVLLMILGVGYHYRRRRDQ